MAEAGPQTSTVAGPGVPTWALLVIPVLSTAYATAGFMNPLLASSPLAIAFLTMLFAIAMSCALAWTGRDSLDPFRLISGCFVLTYCTAPLFAAEGFDWYVRESVPSLMAKGSAMALFAYLSIALGYFLPVFRRPPPLSAPLAMRVYREPATLLAAILFLVGVGSFAVMFVLAGGTERIIASDETRVSFFRGIGFLYHASYSMYTGAALYFVTRLSSSPHSLRSTWRAGWPLVFTALIFVVLQRRSAAVMAVIILIVVSHYLVKPVRMTRTVWWGVALLPVVIFVGYARHPSVRGLLLTNPGAIVGDVVENFIPLLDTFFGHSLNRLKQVMLALDHFPATEPFRWGATLLNSLNPFMRLLGFAGAQTEPLGRTFLQLAHPELSTEIESGFHPSLVGEVLANFPWYAAPMAFTLYGMGVRLLYSRLVAVRRDAVSLAIYSLVIFRVIDMVIVGVGQLIFEILVLGLPLLFARRLLVGPPALAGSNLTDSPAPSRATPA